MLFRGLGDPTRLALIRRLAAGEARVVDLRTELGLSQSTASSHLACLRQCGLVDYRAQGRASVYHLTRYGDLLTGSYDCVDRIVLDAYYPMGHAPGGFRVCGGDCTTTARSSLTTTT